MLGTRLLCQQQQLQQHSLLPPRARRCVCARVATPTQRAAADGGGGQDAAAATTTTATAEQPQEPQEDEQEEIARALTSSTLLSEAMTPTSVGLASSSSSEATVLATASRDGGTVESLAPSPSASPPPPLPAPLPPVMLSGPPQAAVDAGLAGSLTSFEEDMVPAGAGAAAATAKARAALRKAGGRAGSAARQRQQQQDATFWWPPIEFSALLGLCAALSISGLASIFLCKPVVLSASVAAGKHRVMKQCSACCAPPAQQAQHSVLLSRQLTRVLQPLPLPLRQYLDVDQLPEPTYKVPSLVSLPGPSEHGVAAMLVAAQEWVHSRAAYQLQQLAAANVSTKVLALWLLALPFITLAAAAYQATASVSFREAMYKVYALLMRVPGIGIGKEKNPASFFVANLVFLAGAFSFAAVIGIVSDEIKSGIKESRAGNYNMRLHGHIVLLNWSSYTTPVIRHIASAYAEGGMFSNGAPGPWNNRPPVVVLADRSKADMDQALAEMLKDRGLKLEVHTREGNPYKLSDLRKVAASKASTIIVLHPESTSSANAEAIKVSVAMGLTALGAPPEQRVVVQGPSAGTHTVLSSLATTAHQAGGQSSIQAFELPDSQLTDRLVAQTASQPGILTCWLDLLSLTANSAEFYCTSIPPSLQDKPFVELRRAFLHAVLCGYRTPESVVVLNAAEGDVPPPGSTLIFLGRGGAPHLLAAPGDSQLHECAAAAATERLKKEPTYRSKARSIIVTNWPVSGVQQLLEGFAMFTPPGSVITFLLTEEPPAAPTSMGNCRFKYVCTQSPTSVKALLDAGIKSADAVVLGSGAAVAELEADAQILAAVLQVQDAVMLSKRKAPPHLVAPIRRYATSKLASQFLDVLAAEQPPANLSTPSLPFLPAVVHPGAVLPLPTPAAHAAAATASGSAAAAASATASGSTAAAGTSSSSSSSPADAGSSSGAATGSSSTCSSSSSSNSGSSVRRDSLLTSALKAVGALPPGPPSPPAAAVQPPRPPVIADPEFLVPTDVASALITQVLSEPAYSDIMRSLMLCSEGGAELYTRNPKLFNLPTGVELTFAEVQEACRLTRQTAIGYIRGHKSSSSGSSSQGAKQRERQRKAVLGCGASHSVTFDEADRIVVIAQANL